MSCNVNVDPELFILEIEVRPAIWDSRDASYSNRGDKHAAWEEICRKFVDGFDAKTESEKNLCAAEMAKKWKHLRNCYTRELHKQEISKKTGSSEWRKKYKFFDLLSFLSGVCSTKPAFVPDANKNSLMNKRNKVAVEHDRNAAQCKQMKLTEEHALFKELSDSIKHRSKEDMDDPDKQFLLSLLPDFKGIPQNLKIDAKFEIMSILHKYSKPQQQQQQQQYYPAIESTSNYEYVDVKFPAFQDSSTSRCEQSTPSPTHSQTSDS